jgi:hypothetical protein
MLRWNIIRFSLSPFMTYPDHLFTFYLLLFPAGAFSQFFRQAGLSPSEAFDCLYLAVLFRRRDLYIYVYLSSHLHTLIGLEMRWSSVHITRLLISPLWCLDQCLPSFASYIGR